MQGKAKLDFSVILFCGHAELEGDSAASVEIKNRKWSRKTETK